MHDVRDAEDKRLLDAKASVRPSLVVRDRVLTVSDAGVKSSSLATLAERGWAAFPPAEAPRP